MTVLGMSFSTVLLLLLLLGSALGVLLMVLSWRGSGTRYITINVLTTTAALLLLVHKWIHKLTIMHVVAVVSAYGIGLGLFFLIADWRARGPRYITTLLLAAVTFGFSVWHLRYEPPRKPKEYEQVKNRVVKKFAVDKATKITLLRHGTTYTFSKEKGRWMITAPLRFPADADAVENLLTEIKMLDKHRTLDGPRTKAEYGLTKKAVQVTVEGATPTPLTLTLGAKDVTGARIFLAVNDDPKVLMVNKHFADALDKELGELREAAALPFKETDVRAVELVTKDGKRARLTANKKVWTLALGKEALGQRANAKTAEDLVRKLKDLRATTFLGDGKTALARYGLDKPRQVLAVDDGKRHELLLGGPCPKRRTDLLAGRRGRYATVFCLRAKEVRELTLSTGDLRDARLTGADEATLDELSIRSGAKEILLKKKGLDWLVKKPAGSTMKKASASQVEKFVKDLQAYTVLTFLPPPKEGLAKYGLDKPRAVLTMHESGGRTEVIRLGAENADKNYYAQRSGEKMVVVIHRTAGQLITPNLLRFRDRSLLSFRKEPTEAVHIVARTGAVVEDAVYQGGLWTLEKPDKVKVDRDALDALLSVLAMLQAQEFVSEHPLPAQGLAAPTRTITVDLELEDVSKPGKAVKKETHTLKVGRDAPQGGCFGQLDGPTPPVFRLDAQACKDLRALLADRRLAELRLSQVTALKLTRGGGTEQIERRGDYWGRKNGPRVNKTAVENLVLDLAKMRALRVVAYGAPKPAHGLLRPRITVEMVTKPAGAKPVVLKIGAPVKEGNKVVGNYAVVGGRDIVYLLSTADVDVFRKAKL